MSPLIGKNPVSRKERKAHFERKWNLKYAQGTSDPEEAHWDEKWQNRSKS